MCVYIYVCMCVYWYWKWAPFFKNIVNNIATTHMAIAPPPPKTFCQSKKFKSIKTTTYISVYSNMAKICS